MASLKIEEMVSVKYPLNQEAKESLNLLLWNVSDRIGSDCVNFVAGLRPEVQSDVANALWLFRICHAQASRRTEASERHGMGSDGAHQGTSFQQGF